jgi:hypothetical protein
LCAGAIAIAVTAVGIKVFFGPLGYVRRSNLAGLGFSEASIVKQVAREPYSVAIIRVGVPQDGPVFKCVVFKRWGLLPLLEVPIGNPPSEIPGSWKEIKDRRIEVTWNGRRTALVRIDGWTVAYLNFEKRRGSFAEVNSSFEKKAYSKWVDQWRAESERLEREVGGEGDTRPRS